MINWKGRGRLGSPPKLRCNQDVQLDELRHTTKYFTSVRVSAEIRIRYLPKVNQKRQRLLQIAP